MASASQMRGIRNLPKLRKKLREMNKVVENTIKPAMVDAAQTILSSMKEITPVDTGELVGRLKFKVSADGLSAKIGVIQQRDAKKVYYFRFLDAGTKGAPENNVPPQPALHIRDRAFDANKDAIVRKVKQEIDDTLRRAAGL